MQGSNSQESSDGGLVAVVTGAGSGIGRATAVRLAADGYRVALAGRRGTALQKTAELIGASSALVMVCDVTDPEAVGAMVSGTVQAFGRIDVVVNNAGISRTAAFPHVTMTEWREVMATDVESIVLVTQAAMPFLLERGGSIVNVASVAGLGGDPGMVMYNAAKGAVVNLTRSLAVEFAARGVRVNAVAPSLTSTDATADISAEDVAEFVRRIPWDERPSRPKSPTSSPSWPALTPGSSLGWSCQSTEDCGPAAASHRTGDGLTRPLTDHAPDPSSSRGRRSVPAASAADDRCGDTGGPR